MVNLTFSVEKNRELSILEARVKTIRRRFTDPLGKNIHSLVARAAPIVARVGDPLIGYLEIKVL